MTWQPASKASGKYHCHVRSQILSVAGRAPKDIILSAPHHQKLQPLYFQKRKEQEKGGEPKKEKEKSGSFCSDKSARRVLSGTFSLFLLFFFFMNYYFFFMIFFDVLYLIWV
jgi:hypothetical protein